MAGKLRQDMNDSPKTASLSRRQILLVSAASAGALAAAQLGGAIVLAGSGTKTPLPLPAGTLDHFMAFSRLATGHAALSPMLGERLYRALAGQDAEFPGKLTGLINLVRYGPDPTVEALEVVARASPALHEALLAVIRAWYSGVVGTGSNATVYAYEAALMYQPARDQVVIPTFAHGGPNYWVKTPPPVDAVPAF